MLPRPATPATKATTAWSLRLPRDAALLLLRNNLFALAGITLFNYFFPFYPHLKRALLPRIWLQPYNKIEFWVITLAFGLNILVALISIRYPRAPFPPIRTPVKPATTGTPVRRRVTGLGTSPLFRPSASGHSLSSSGYASTPFTTPSRTANYSMSSSTGTPLNHSSGSGASYNSSPLAAYIGRHANASRTGRPIDARLLETLTAEDDTQY